MNKPALALVPALIEQHTAPDKQIEYVKLTDMITEGLQLRITVSKDTISRYAEIYSEGKGKGDEMPPVKLFRDGPNLYLADGHQRHAAGKIAGLAKLPAIIKKGTYRDAKLYATRANVEHGAPLTNDDKRNIVRTLLADDEWRKWSNREIAKHAQVSPNFVGKLRDSLPKEQQSTVRKGKDGVDRDTKNIGKAPLQPAPSLAPDQMAAGIAWQVDEKEKFKWNESKVCQRPNVISILAAERQTDKVAAELDLACKDGKWFAGFNFRISGANAGGGGHAPSHRDGGSKDWRKIAAKTLREDMHEALKRHKVSRLVLKWLLDLADAVEKVDEPKPMPMALPKKEGGKGNAAATPSTPRPDVDLYAQPETTQRLAAARKLGDLIRAGGVVDAAAASERVLLVIFMANEWKTAEGIAESAKLNGEYVIDDLQDLIDRGLVVPTTRKDKLEGFALTDAGTKAALKVIADGEPETLLPPRREGDSEGEEYSERGKETPPLADDTHGARVLKRTREILADRLLKGKDQCRASSEQLVSLGLVVGIPVSADDEPWSDDLVAGCWHRLTVRLQAELADRLNRGETHRLPPLQQIASWWSMDIHALSIQAERAVGKG